MPEAVRPLANDSEGYLPGGQTQRKIIFFFFLNKNDEHMDG